MAGSGIENFNSVWPRLINCGQNAKLAAEHPAPPPGSVKMYCSVMPNYAPSGETNGAAPG